MRKLLLMVSFITSMFAGSYKSLLFHGNCITCHDTKHSKSAPTIQSIKKAYLDAFNSKEEFVEYMSLWVYTPNEKTSIMSQAIEQYGVMPQLAYDKEVLKDIARFIYEHDFDK